LEITVNIVLKEGAVPQVLIVTFAHSVIVKACQTCALPKLASSVEPADVPVKVKEPGDVKADATTEEQLSLTGGGSAAVQVTFVAIQVALVPQGQVFIKTLTTPVKLATNVTVDCVAQPSSLYPI
jgi:hypothetical protein